MDDIRTDDELRKYLVDQGYSEREILEILKKVEDYERRIQSDSVFDSIQAGSFSIDDIIKDALKDLPPENQES